MYYLVAILKHPLTALRLLVPKVWLHLADVNLDLAAPSADGRYGYAKVFACLLQRRAGREAPGQHLLLESTIVLSLHLYRCLNLKCKEDVHSIIFTKIKLVNFCNLNLK